MPHTAEGIKAYRQRNPEYVARDTLFKKARHRALYRLKDLFSVEFEVLFEQEKQRLENESTEK